MGLYFRKSKSIGPARVNLSKSGIGVSTGVKGARISFGPKGTYVNVGRNGLYYKKKLGGSKKNSGQAKGGSHKYTKKERIPDNYKEIDYNQENAIRINRGNESLLGKEIIRDVKVAKASRIISVIIAVILLAYIKWWTLPVMGIALIVFRSFLTSYINYDFDDEAKSEWADFIGNLYNCYKENRRVWLIMQERSVSRSKTNAGAVRNVTRSVCTVVYRKAKRTTGFGLRTNVDTFAINNSRISMLFLPSGIIIKRGGVYSSCSYEDLSIVCTSGLFVENEAIPRDAYIQGYTWQYVNKDGSPDMRFKGNKQIPQCLYGSVMFCSSLGLSIEYKVSNYQTVKQIEQAYLRYRTFIHLSDNAEARIDGKSLRIDKQSQANIKLADEINGELRKVAKEVKKTFEEILSCKVKFVDGQYYNGYSVMLFETSKDVADLLPYLEEEFNKSSINDEYKIHPVNNCVFLLEYYCDIDAPDGFETVLSEDIAEAYSKAKIYKNITNRNKEIERQKQNDILKERVDVSKKGISVFDDFDYEVAEDEDYDFEVDDVDIFAEKTDDRNINKSKSNNQLIDDMMMFLDEE